MKRAQPYEVRVADRALSDLAEIHAYIERSSAIAATQLMARMAEAIDSLERFPARHAIAVESRALGYRVRAMAVFRYRVLYRVRGRLVEVVRVRHSARRRDRLARDL